MFLEIKKEVGVERSSPPPRDHFDKFSRAFPSPRKMYNYIGGSQSVDLNCWSGYMIVAPHPRFQVVQGHISSTIKCSNHPHPSP
jgi:hypothetical protein